MKKITLALLILLATGLAQAAGGGHGDEHIPLDKIGWQAVNLGILLVAIVFFIRKSMVEAFAARKENYLSQAEKTKAALKDAEAALADIKAKLAALESGEQASLEKAKKEAAELKESLIKDAEAGVEKLKRDAQLTLANELMKAKEEINALIVNQAVLSTKQKLGSQASAASTQEANFIKQLEQVRP